MGLAMATKLNIAEWTSESGRTANREDSGELRREVEHRAINKCSEAQRKEKAMDKTLADSFPASDPPAWQG
jgi:hypothetical protein